MHYRVYAPNCGCSLLNCHGMANAFYTGNMNTSLLADLKMMFGTVSGKTENSGVVAVRNVTAYRKLAMMVEGRATLTPVTSGFPQLVKVTEVPR